MKKLILSLIATMLFAIPAFATTYYASPSGGGAASCVDNSTNVCTLQRAITVAAGGTNTIELANGTYSCSTSCAFNATNTGANLTLQKANGATVTVGSTGTSYVFDIQSTMVSGSITFDGVGITDTDTDYGVHNQAPEVNVTYKNATISETDATAGNAFKWDNDTTNKISLTTGEDTLTGLKTGATTNVKVAQKIVPGANMTINRASIKMQRKCGNTNTMCDTFVSGESWDYRNSETLTVTIETDTAGAPSGTPVTNGTATTKLAFNVPFKSAEWEIFKFASNVSLTSGTTYWLVITGSYTASATNYIALSTDTGDGYASGDASTYNGTSWSAAAAGTDLLFTVDRAHTRTITVQDNTITTRASTAAISWSDTVQFSRNTLTSTAGGGVSVGVNGGGTTADDQFKRVIFEDNVVNFTTSLSQMVTAGINTFVFTYLDALIIKGNSGTVDLITNPNRYVKKFFFYGNTLTVQSNGNAPMILGQEVNGTDPEEIAYAPMDQAVIENNDITYSASSHNHLFLLGIGSEGGVFINNTLRAPNSAGAGGGGWGIIIKADNWTIAKNRFYGPGPAVYPTSNYNVIIDNTFETYDSSGSNAAILFRNHQDNVYGGNHGIPKFNFVENNVFISNGAYAALTHCDNTNCSTGSPSTLGYYRTEEYWSNRIDNNFYYARDNSTSYNMQIGAGTNLENVTLAEGIGVARTAWASSTYTDKDSIAQYNDMRNSIIASPSGISGSSYVWSTRDPNIVGKGLWTNQSIGAYQPAVGPEAVGQQKQ